MSLTEDTYKTIACPSPEILFKDRKSKFFGYAFPVKHEAEVKPIIEELKRKYPSANHFCYAWQIGVENMGYRANDDGEPKNSAGMPIYGQLLSFELTNVLIVVARVFGGAKLGVSGLINAYRTTAQMAIGVSIIETKIIEKLFELQFEYALMNDVMRILKKLQVRIVSQKSEDHCRLTIAVAKSKTGAISNEIKRIHQLKVIPL